MAPLLLRGIHCILLVLPAGSAVCADTAPPPTAAAASTLEQPVAGGNRWPGQQDYDEVIAVVPQEQAALASVVLAEVNIALHDARRRTQQALCAGQWAPNGTLLLQYGPQLEAPDPAAANARAWIYRAIRQPNDIACDQVTRVGFFLEMSRHLPDWITIRPAGQPIAYRQGQGILPPQQARMAAR
jgi:hypothetical protein